MTKSVDTVPVEQLHTRLGYKTPIDYPASSRTKSLSDWKMEIDDSPIFRYLYRNHRPRRHLEFGTWQGTGVCYVLDECDATVWTINLPFGEDDKPGGLPAYANDIEEAEDVKAWAAKLGLARVKNFYWTDKIGFVGRHYLERELGNRVCQIYCNSKDWNNRQFPHDFFDSVLIDGAHAPEIVVSDTRKALEVTSPGALIVWHDFCLDEEVRTNYSTPREMVANLEANFDWIRPQLQDLFWVEPSWMLVGVKAGSNRSASSYFRRLGDAIFNRPTEVGVRTNGSAK